MEDCKDCKNGGQCWEHSEDAPCEHCHKTPCELLFMGLPFCSEQCINAYHGKSVNQ